METGSKITSLETDDINLNDSFPMDHVSKV